MPHGFVAIELDETPLLERCQQSMNGGSRQAGADRKIAQPISLIVFGKGFDNEKSTVYGLYAAIPGIGVVVRVGFRLDEPAPDHVSLHPRPAFILRCKGVFAARIQKFRFAYNPPGKCRSGLSEAASVVQVLQQARTTRPICTWRRAPRPAILSSMRVDQIEYFANRIFGLLGQFDFTSGVLHHLFLLHVHLIAVHAASVGFLAYTSQALAMPAARARTIILKS